MGPSSASFPFIFVLLKQGVLVLLQISVIKYPFTYYLVSSGGILTHSL